MTSSEQKPYCSQKLLGVRTVTHCHLQLFESMIKVSQRHHKPEYQDKWAVSERHHSTEEMEKFYINEAERYDDYPDES